MIEELRRELNAIARNSEALEGAALVSPVARDSARRLASRIHAAAIRALSALEDAAEERVERHFEITNLRGVPVEVVIGGPAEQVESAVRSAAIAGVNLREKP